MIKKNPVRNPAYGVFKDDAYVLRRIDTPRAWYNVLSNDNYFLQVSQLGSGFSVYRTQMGNLVTRWAWPNEDAGRFFYIRDSRTGRFWSPTVWPVETDTQAFDRWTCTYRPGFMQWDAVRDGLEVRLTAAVAHDDNVELYRLEIADQGGRARELDLFLSVEWAFQGAPHELGQSLRCDYDRRAGCLVSELEIPPQWRFCQTGFMASSEPTLSWDGGRRPFLGQPGTIGAPLAVSRGRCSNTPNGRLTESPGGAIHTRVKLARGERKAVAFAVGIAANRAAVAALRRQYSPVASVAKHYARVEARWSGMAARQVLHAGEKSDVTFFDWASTWLKLQVVQNFRYTRWGYERGYRDVLQDSAGMRLIDPPLARGRIVEALSHQKASGYAPRQYAVEPWGAFDWRDYRDSPFWIVYGLEKYLKETGDLDLLHEPVPFFDRQKPDTVFGHACRAMDHLWRERGAHGLCLLGRGDWLDSLNNAGVRGKGESIWLSMALCYALREMERLAPLAGKPALAGTFRARRRRLADIVNREGWDGRWYLMAFNDDGDRIGSAACPDGGRVFLNPQSWAVLAGVADARRTRTVMRACDEQLKFDAGYLCFAPMYSRFDPGVGRISLWPSEGGSVYTHAVIFKISADCLLGEGDRAWETLRRVVPMGGLLPLSESGAEPFVVPNAYMGPQWPNPKSSYQGWWTASADWVLQVLVEQILGACADYDGLRIDPCLPRAMTRARIERHFRGSTYDIRITKPNGICRGKVTLRVDGKRMSGNLIKPDTQPGRHIVEAVIEEESHAHSSET